MSGFWSGTVTQLVPPYGAKTLTTWPCWPVGSIVRSTSSVPVSRGEDRADACLLGCGRAVQLDLLPDVVVGHLDHLRVVE